MAKLANPQDRWIKLFWLRFKSSARVLRMKDYQRFWYLSLCAESQYTEKPGYLHNDLGLLYALSGCTQSVHYFQERWQPVRECFEATADGRWLFNRRTLEVAGEITSPPSSSLSLDLNVVEFSELENCVEELFVLYKQLLEKNSNYTLTDERRKKCGSRLCEYMTTHSCKLEGAKAAAETAIRNLAGSDWNLANGYTDWLEQIFRSRETFEKRLTTHPRKQVSTRPSEGIMQNTEVASDPEEVKRAVAMYWERQGKKNAR